MEPARQTHGSYRLGTNPLPTDVAQQAARLFFELSRDVDPLIRLAGFRLRVAFAQLHPLVTPLPAESFVSFDARCTPRNDLLEITSVLDVTSYDSFPASDPPSWIATGIGSPQPDQSSDRRVVPDPRVCP